MELPPEDQPPDLIAGLVEQDAMRAAQYYLRVHDEVRCEYVAVELTKHWMAICSEDA